MRVIQTSKAYSPLVGGIETTITNLSEGLAESGVDVEVLVCSHERSFRIQRDFQKVPVVSAPTWGFMNSLPLSPAYFRLLMGMRGDILHIHEPFPLASLSVLLSGSIRDNFRRVVVSWHSDIIRQKWILASYRPLIHRFLRGVDRIIVSSENLLKSSEFLPIHRHRCEVIPLGVNLGWARKMKFGREQIDQIHAVHGRPLLLFVGRLVYYKGLEYLLEALALLPEARLLIIGSGPLLPSLRARIASSGLQDRVHIIPPVPADELHRFFEACDVFVLPSTEKSEAYGLVQIEAMACGKPVVTTNLNTGITFLNIHGTTGLTVPPRDSSALAQALDRLLKNPRLRRTLGRKARERALREFSSEKMVRKTLAMYEKLLAEPGTK